MDTTTPAPTPAIAPSLTYSRAGGVAAWPAETKAIVLAAAAMSVVGLAVSANIFWIWLRPGAFQRVGVEPWPAFSVSILLIASRVLFDAMVVAGAAGAAARLRAARALLLLGAAGLVVVAVAGQVRNSFFFEPTNLSNNEGLPDLIHAVVSQLTWLAQSIIVHLLLIYALTRPSARAAPPAGGP